jgi:hypothetical protein
MDLEMIKNTGIFPRKINIGCGFSKLDGYLNVDSHPDCQPDVLIIDNDLSILPQGYFENVSANDVLEHIPRADMMNVLLDWVRLLKMGGEMFVQTSYIYGILEVMRGNDTFETAHNWKRCLFGNQAHPGDWHFNGFTKKTLKTYLEAAGLTVRDIGVKDDWLIYAYSTKTEDWSELLQIENHVDFVHTSFLKLLHRPPEDFHYSRLESKPNSAQRWHEIKILAGCDERLFRIGRQLEDI